MAKYNYKVKTRKELKDLVNKLIKERGNNCDLNDIDVSEVTDMNNLFSWSKFNSDISNWNVSKVIDMSKMFYDSDFNQDISNWNVSKVKDMRQMFTYSAYTYQKPNFKNLTESSNLSFREYLNRY